MDSAIGDPAGDNPVTEQETVQVRDRDDRTDD
jgi:hypothetical protein